MAQSVADITIQAGQLFLLTNGYYSDYCVFGLFRALKDFSVKDTMAVWRSTEFACATWFQTSGLAEEVDFTEINTSDYEDDR